MQNLHQVSAAEDAFVLYARKKLLMNEENKFYVNTVHEFQNKCFSNNGKCCKLQYVAKESDPAPNRVLDVEIP
jgi:hypothetical protein